MLSTYSTVLAALFPCSAFLISGRAHKKMRTVLTHRLQTLKMSEILINDKVTAFSLLFAAVLRTTFPLSLPHSGQPEEFKGAEICRQENHFEILVSCSVYTVVYT